jgi:hypothetical protein
LSFRYPNKAFRPIEGFSLDGCRDDRVRHLRFRERDTTVAIDAGELEAAFQHDDCYLLFVPDWGLTKEGLTLVYVSPLLTLLEKIDITSLYAAGDLHDLVIVDDHTIDFSFFADERWRLTIHGQPKLVITLPCGLSLTTRRVISSVWDTVRRRHLELRRIE